MGGGAMATAVDSLGATAVQAQKPGATFSWTGYGIATGNGAVQTILGASGAVGWVASRFVPQKVAAATGLAQTSGFERQAGEATLKTVGLAIMARMARMSGVDGTGAGEAVVDVAVADADAAEGGAALGSGDTATVFLHDSAHTSIRTNVGGQRSRSRWSR